MSADHAAHSRWALRTRFVSARQWLARFPFSILQLGLRIGVGAVFFNSGLLKYRSFEFAVKLFEDEFKVPLLDPALAARLAMFNELTFPVLLFLGLATRLATLPLLGMIAIIQTFVFPNAWPDHVFWSAALVLLLTRGAGVFSLDYLIDQYLAKGKQSAMRKEGELSHGSRAT